jgi:hypothetical protein
VTRTLKVGKEAIKLTSATERVAVAANGAVKASTVGAIQAGRNK